MNQIFEPEQCKLIYILGHEFSELGHSCYS